ncbi:hypothetical protein RUND412_004277 [Rhizina undulata]
MVTARATTPRKNHDDDDDHDNIPCKTPSPRSSASQAPPNPRHVENEAPSRPNPHGAAAAATSSHPFKGLSRRFMAKRHSIDGDPRSKENLERFRKLDLGAPQGVYDTVSVRERVRRWQAAGGGVVNGDPIEMPPISPATPSPAVNRRRTSSDVKSPTIDALSSPIDLRSPPLTPPRPIREPREWDSASEAEKKAERKRAMSKDRERKMKRRRDRERDQREKEKEKEKEKAKAASNPATEVDESVGGAPLRTDVESTFTKSIYEDDGIRVSVVKPRRRGSAGSKKKKKAQDGDPESASDITSKQLTTTTSEFSEGTIGPGVKLLPRTPENDDNGNDEADDGDDDDDESMELKKVEVKAWDYEDGIRIYRSKINTPIARSQTSGHSNSIRRGEKSVKARKDEFEAELRKEKKAQKEFEDLVRQQEEEDRVKEEKDKERVEKERWDRDERERRSRERRERLEREITEREEREKREKEEKEKKERERREKIEQEKRDKKEKEEMIKRERERRVKEAREKLEREKKEMERKAREKRENEEKEKKRKEEMIRKEMERKAKDAKEQKERQIREEKARETAERAYEGSSVTTDSESDKKSWDEYDEGIRVKPLKARRKKSPSEANTRPNSSLRQSLIIEDSALDSLDEGSGISPVDVAMLELERAVTPVTSKRSSMIEYTAKTVDIAPITSQSVKARIVEIQTKEKSLSEAVPKSRRTSSPQRPSKSRASSPTSEEVPKPRRTSSPQRPSKSRASSPTSEAVPKSRRTSSPQRPSKSRASSPTSEAKPRGGKRSPSPPTASAAPLRTASPKPKAKAEVSKKDDIILDEAPRMIPKRSIRNSPAPPRPKSMYSHRSSKSEGTASSGTGEDLSFTGSPSTRSNSEASNSTIKASKTSTAESAKTKPQSTVPQPLNTSRSVGNNAPNNSNNAFSPDGMLNVPGVKRKFTKHADLISLLSVPKSSKSGSKARTHKKTVSTLTTGDLLAELAAEEIKYMRELRTLVEDVVPVLFATVLERADDVVRRTTSNASGSSAHSQSVRSSFSSNPTRPIVDMGISLERLKTLHERIPKKSPDELLSWATDAKKVYEEYLSVWRMGFQDVVVTLAPLIEDNGEHGAYFKDDAAIRKDLELLNSFGMPPSPSTMTFEGDQATWDMPPPPLPAFVEQEERVDVAFLLKRPLVRLKILAKLFKRINYLQASPTAASLSTSFHSLVTMARRKVAEEKARIEDEAAASIDVSKVSELHSLLPKPGVTLDPSRRVRARDSFLMTLYHSTGMILERNVELILRDPATKGRGDSEVLICEFGRGSNKWLLFGPIPLAAISSRTGDAANEIVVMVRGMDPETREQWKEIMTLGSDSAAGFEWVQMLGLLPIPPEGPFTREPYRSKVLSTVMEESLPPSRMQTPVFVREPELRSEAKSEVAAETRSEVPTGARLEVPAEMKSKMTAETKSDIDVFSFLVSEDADEDEETTYPAQGLGISQSRTPVSIASQNTFGGQPPVSEYQLAELRPVGFPPDFAITPLIAGGYSFEGGSFALPENIRRDYELDDNNSYEGSFLQRTPSLHTMAESETSEGRSPSIYSVQRSRAASRPPQLRQRSIASLDEVSESELRSPSPAPSSLRPESTLSRSQSVHLDEDQRPRIHTRVSVTRRPSGTPKLSIDNIPVLPPPSPVQSESSEASTVEPEGPCAPITPKDDKEKAENKETEEVEEEEKEKDKEASAATPEAPPPVPPHRSPTVSRASSPQPDARSPQVQPQISAASVRSAFNARRRTSSPLKHEYDPSTASDTTSEDQEDDSDESESEDEDEETEEKVLEIRIEERAVEADSSSSESEDEESDDAVSLCSEEEDGDYPPPMLSIPRRISKEPSGTISLPRQRPSSLSMSGAPTVQGQQPATKLKASVFTWATDKWDKLYPDDCQIIITSGHVEAVPAPPPSVSSAPETGKDKPSLEKIDTRPESRSSTGSTAKPTNDSTVSLSQIFSLDLTHVTPIRRGTAVDISIRTPTTSKFNGSSLMLRSRSPAECEMLFAALNNHRLFPVDFKAPTNHSSFAPSEMTATTTDLSNMGVGSIKRGWGSWGRSRTYRSGANDSTAPSIVSSGPSEASVGSLSSAFSRLRQKAIFKNSSLGSAASSSSSNGDSPRGSSPNALVPEGPQFKIRLYRRENASKWRDLGSSKLSILKPPDGFKPHKGGEIKRVLVTNKAGNVVLLDELLAETSFERVARTGIAVSILVGEGQENGTGVPGNVGGLGSRSTVYMMQMKGEAEAAYVFSIVGKLRY